MWRKLLISLPFFVLGAFCIVWLPLLHLSFISTGRAVLGGIMFLLFSFSVATGKIAV